jgi:hypothetical protein
VARFTPPHFLPADPLPCTVRQKPDTTWTCRFENKRYINAVNYLTKQEQMVLIIVLGLLFIGWTIKAYRTAHPSAVAVQPVKP